MIPDTRDFFSGNLKMIPHHWLKYNPVTAYIAKTFLVLFNRDLESVVFVATTGRSGSETLSRVFDTIAHCSSLHEPYPIMNGELMVQRNQGKPDLAKSTYDYIKSVNIRRTAAGSKYYVETNHTFVKSFIDYAAADFKDKLKVIHLYRNPVDVALSILSLNNYPDCYPGTPNGNHWYLDYRARENLIQISDDLDSNPDLSHTFYKCLWYWFEIEARVLLWKHKLPDTLFIDFNINSLKDKTSVTNMLEKLNINYESEKINDVLTISSNAKKQHKKKILDPLQALEMTKNFVNLLHRRSFPVPDTFYEFSDAHNIERAENENRGRA